MIVGVVQARATSTRFPGKVLKSIAGMPSLAFQLQRLSKSRLLDKLIVATSTDGSDDLIEDLCVGLGVKCFRGSLDDVLDRVYKAAIDFKPHHLVRLTADCPLGDATIIDQVIEEHLKKENDYTNAVNFPDGLDVEVVKFKAFESAWKNAKLKSEREHVTLHVYKNPEIYKIGAFESKENLRSYRWTVDYPQDLDFVNAVVARLLPKYPNFSWIDVLSLIKSDHQIQKLNSQFVRDEGLLKSLNEDQNS